MLDVGFTATRKTMGAPLVKPPFTPPEPFFKGPSGPKGSLCSEPFIRAAANPSPNSMPRTPGIANMA